MKRANVFFLDRRDMIVKAKRSTLPALPSSVIIAPQYDRLTRLFLHLYRRTQGQGTEASRHWAPAPYHHCLAIVNAYSMRNAQCIHRIITKRSHTNRGPAHVAHFKLSQVTILNRFRSCRVSQKRGILDEDPNCDLAWSSKHKFNQKALFIFHFASRQQWRRSSW